MRRRLPSFCLRTPDAQDGQSGAVAPASNTAMANRMELETRRLGNSDMDITPIGFGAWALGGGDWEFAWGEQDDRESVAAIERALELGINWIDTAAVYGLGHSEEVVGRALKGRAEKPYVFTKCSMRWNTEERKIYRSLRGASLREECEASLRRLQIDVIDLYQIHWPDPEGELDEGWETMARLKEEGKVRWIGVSNFSIRQMERAQKIAPITSLQPPYSLVKPGVQQEILPWVKEQGIGVINYSPMASGLLTGKMTAERVREMPEDDWRKKNPAFKGEKLERNLRLAALLGEIGKKRDVQPGVVAIAWTLHNPAVTAAIVGARRPDQVDGVLPAANFRLSDAEYDEIEAFVKENPA